MFILCTWAYSHWKKKPDIIQQGRQVMRSYGLQKTLSDVYPHLQRVTGGGMYMREAGHRQGRKGKVSVKGRGERLLQRMVIDLFPHHNIISNSRKESSMSYHTHTHTHTHTHSLTHSLTHTHTHTHTLTCLNHHWPVEDTIITKEEKYIANLMYGYLA